MNRRSVCIRKLNRNKAYTEVNYNGEVYLVSARCARVNLKIQLKGGLN